MIDWNEISSKGGGGMKLMLTLLTVHSGKADSLYTTIVQPNEPQSA